MDDWERREYIQQVPLPREKKDIHQRAWAVIQEGVELPTLPVAPCYEQVYQGRSSPLESTEHDIWVERPLMAMKGPAEVIGQFVLRAQKIQHLQVYQVCDAEVPQPEGFLTESRRASTTLSVYIEHHCGIVCHYQYTSAL